MKIYLWWCISCLKQWICVEGSNNDFEVLHNPSSNVHYLIQVKRKNKASWLDEAAR